MRRTAIAFLGWLATTLYAAQTPTDPGHLFIPVGKTHPSYNSWAISIPINVASYRERISIVIQTQADLKNGTIANTTLPSAQRAMLPLYANQLDAAQTQLSGEINGLLRTFRDVLYPPEASGPVDVVLSPEASVSPDAVHQPGSAKRGLIDGLGNAMSYLFFTATESEIKHLTNNVQLINAKDTALAHRFNGTLKVPNHTRIATIQNRRALSTLTAAVHSLNIVYAKTFVLVQANANAIETAMHTAELTNCILHVSQSVQYIYTELSALSHKFALAQAGILHKNIIPRGEFIRLLRKIDKSLPLNFALPFLSEQTTEYVRTVKTKLVEGADAYHVLFYIPLLHTKHAFDVYRFFPYQVPLHDHNVSLSYYLNEPRYILMSENRQQFIQPSPSLPNVPPLVTHSIYLHTTPVKPISSSRLPGLLPCTMSRPYPFGALNGHSNSITSPGTKYPGYPTSTSMACRPMLILIESKLSPWNRSLLTVHPDSPSYYTL